MPGLHWQEPILVLGSVNQFAVSLLALGGLLALGALVSGVAHRSFLSLTALFVLAGFVLGHGALGVLKFNARSGFVSDLATVALVVILFRDGLEIDAELLQTQWRLPLRKLALAMPITFGIVAVGAHVLTNLSWTECFLLGALLSPTDPVLSSGVVTNLRVPSVVRHSLNLESGLNDGLALPVVLAFSSSLSGSGKHFVWWHFVLQDVSIGLATGVVVGLCASVLVRVATAIADHQKSLYALGTAFAAYGIALLPPHGNGLIAAYVAGITFGIRCPEIRREFERQAADLVEIVKLGIFVVFGSLLTLHGLFTDGWAAVGVAAVTLLVARTAAVMLALLGTDTDIATRGFMAWFGPKGVATMTFSLLVLNEGIAAGSRIFNIAALVVFCSVLVHGATDTFGSNWIAQRSERTPEAALP